MHHLSTTGLQTLPLAYINLGLRIATYTQYSIILSTMGNTSVTSLWLYWKVTDVQYFIFTTTELDIPEA